MKGKTGMTRGFLPFLLAFVFVAAMQLDMNAQSNVTYQTTGASNSPASYKNLYDLPAGPFVSVEIAKERLMDAMKTLKVTMSQYAEGTGPYETAYTRYKYYSMIHGYLEAGKAVPNSISEGLEAINNGLTTALTPEQASAERNAAINLLRP